MTSRQRRSGFLLVTAWLKSISGSHRQRTANIGPAERLGGAIEVVNKRQETLPQRLHRWKVAALDHAPHENAEPDFDLIEPRRMLGHIHKLNSMGRIAQERCLAGHALQHITLALHSQINPQATALRPQLA